MAFVIKNWTARQGTGLNRYYDSISGQYLSLTNAPIEVTSEGNSTHSISNLQDLENRIETDSLGLHAEVSALQSGAPKGVTLASQMTETAKNYLYLGAESGYTYGYVYYHNGTSWVAGWAYQALNIADGAVTPIKTSFFVLEKSKNIFDKNLYVGGALTPDGTVYGVGTFPTWKIYGYYEVEPNTTYVISQRTGGAGYPANVCQYNASKTYVTGVQVNLSTLLRPSIYYTTITTSATTKYIRLSQSTTTTFTDANLATFQVEKNTLPTSYDSYWTKYWLDNAYIKGTNSFASKRIMYLGDSITALGQWVTAFNTLVNPSSYVNVAVSGSHWCDYVGTVLDGNPVLGGADNNVNNTISNQVQKILNNNYSAPDVIIIAAGTNDTNTFSVDNDAIESQFTNESGYIALASVDRKTYAGAMRWTVETLQNKYPNAQIFICTPIQAAFGTRPYNTDNGIYLKGEMIKRVSRRLALPVWDTAECGIYGAYEVHSGSGKYLSDGIHPNTAGGDMIAKYNARQFIDWYSF